MGPLERPIVLRAIIDACQHKTWHLMAVHIRTTHVHVVLDADTRPEQPMTTLKAYASRALNMAGLGPASRPRWVRHGSTRYLWSKESIDRAVGYVLDGQGERMAWYEAPVRSLTVAVP